MTDQWQVAEELLLQPTDVDTNQIQDALGQMLSRQVDYADLYFEYSRREAFSLEEGRIQGGSYGIDQGVGVRAVSGEKTGFAYSDEIVP
ncbi:MAG TPA: DNA gyrase modulator, partial [Gammaproteobacteria bacterium]|nr:DNA gyrase modulator [Gammaproteobacteria bacterium]